MWNLAVGNYFYRCIYFREVNYDGSFQLLEFCHYYLLYWLLCPELFFYQRVSVFQFNGLTSQFRLIVAKPYLAHLFTVFHKTRFSIHITHRSVNFTWFALLSHKAWKTVWFATFVNSLNWNSFTKNQFKQCSVYIDKKF